MRRRMILAGGVLVLAVQWIAMSAWAEGGNADTTVTTPVVSGAPATNAAPGSAGSIFDRAFAVNGPGREAGAGPAGRVVERFAPPVAAPMDPSTMTRPFTSARGALLRPCDTPGSGCRNPSASTPPAGVPPIGPGTRPPITSPGTRPGS